MKKSISDFLYKILSCNFFYRIVLFLSHGGFHFVLLVFLSFGIFYLAKKATGEIGPEYHDIGIKINGDCDSGNYQMKITAHINSDSLGCASQCLIIQPLYVNSDTNKCCTYSRISVEVNRSYCDLPYYLDSQEISSDMESKNIITAGSEIYIKKASNSEIEFVNIPNGDVQIPLYSFYCDNLFAPRIEKNNPYYYFNLKIDAQGFDPEIGENRIVVFFGNIKPYKYGQVNASRGLKYQYVYPEPDLITFGEINYTSKEKLQKVIDNGGIIVQAEDIEIKNKNERESILVSVLLGTLVAFWIDVVINLVIKWRNIALKMRNNG